MAAAATTYHHRRAIVPCPFISPSYSVPPSSFAVTHASSLRVTPACRVRFSILRPAVLRRGSVGRVYFDSSLDESTGSNPNDESIDSSKCAGCQRYHKLVDNLVLVMEDDLRENYNEETNTDQ